ncbi:putative phosphoglycerate mutase [Scheffersomyces xylosifermentans]|uniref:putative phosphoglycerate mutase n=1 Tax=Scheffersomyces xylosifermentans TaxID=1304137 RepID=UPI00315C764F
MTIDVASNEDAKVLRIFVVRHGQTDHNVQKILQGHLDIDLNNTGKVQSERVGQYFSQIKIDEFISSDLVRCRNTVAEIVNRQEEDAKLRFTANLREREMGIVQGMYLKDALAQFGENFRNMGETKAQLLSRIETEWSRIIKQNNHNKNVLVCTHGGVITGFTNHLYKDRQYKLHNDLTAKDLRVPFNTSVTIIDINKETNEGTIQTFGNTAHLGGQFEVADQRLR